MRRRCCRTLPRNALEQTDVTIGKRRTSQHHPVWVKGCCCYWCRPMRREHIGMEEVAEGLNCRQRLGIGLAVGDVVG